VNSIYIENACAKAVEENDTEWLYFLYEISVQLHINKDYFKDNNLYHEMKNAYEEA